MNKEQIWHKLEKLSKKQSKKIKRCNRDKKNKTKMSKLNKMIKSEYEKTKEDWKLYLKLKMQKNGYNKELT